MHSVGTSLLEGGKEKSHLKLKRGRKVYVLAVAHLLTVRGACVLVTVSRDYSPKREHHLVEVLWAQGNVY